MSYTSGKANAMRERMSGPGGFTRAKRSPPA